MLYLFISLIFFIIVFFVQGSNIAFDETWLQSTGPTGDLIWNIVDPSEIGIIDEPQFRLYTPTEGIALTPNSIVPLLWTMRQPNSDTPTAYSNPSYIRLELWYNNQLVNIISHALLNNGNYNWVVRLPRSWSNEYFYHIKILSNYDPHVYSYSPKFRISQPNASTP